MVYKGDRTPRPWTIDTATPVHGAWRMTFLHGAHSGEYTGKMNTPLRRGLRTNTLLGIAIK